MPKCGGSPASVVEKAIACGSVTTASVSAITDCSRTSGSSRGSAASALSAAPLVIAMAVTGAQRIGVAGERRHDGHHELLPCRDHRPLAVAGGTRQRADVVGDIPALLVVEAALLARGHVAADETRHDRVDRGEVHARVEAVGVATRQRGVDHDAVHYAAKALRAVAVGALLPVQMPTAHVVVAALERSRGGNLLDALLRIAVADLEVE